MTTGYRITRLHSIAELRGRAPCWNALWESSEIALPTARAELLASWCEAFVPRDSFCALVVQHGGQWVAALPLVEKRRVGCRIATLPGNCWSPAGDLLIDRQADAAHVCDLLVRELSDQHWPVAWFDALPGGMPRWQEFLAATKRANLKTVRRERFCVNTVAIGPDWNAYFDSRSRNHRRHMRKSMARAEQQGDTLLTVYDDFADVEPLLRTCFEIEARGWKGASQSAVLNIPHIWRFYLAQARQLAEWGELRLALLHHAGQPIAFEYGWLAKRTYFSPKVGYDPAFAALTPGQLLRAKQIEHFFDTQEVDAFDFLGPASDATAKWATGEYPVDRVVIALQGRLSRLAVGAYGSYWPPLRRFVNGRVAGNASTTTTASKRAPSLEVVPAGRRPD